MEAGLAEDSFYSALAPLEDAGKDAEIGGVEAAAIKGFDGEAVAGDDGVVGVEGTTAVIGLIGAMVGGGDETLVTPHVEGFGNLVA